MPKLSDFLDSPYEAADRVSFGARILDEVWPDWLDKIDLDQLDMDNGLFCVGGQLMRSINDDFGYLHFKNKLIPLVGGIMTQNDEFNGPSAFMDACGFAVINDWSSERETDYVHEEYQALTDAWREEILSRRDRGNVFSRNSRHEFKRDVAELLKLQKQLSLPHVIDDQIIGSQTVTHLRDVASSLLTSIGHLQADLDRTR